jgi:hypothetical protein
MASLTRAYEEKIKLYAGVPNSLERPSLRHSYHYVYLGPGA